ncbi:MAG: phosphatase PAP2 family protein [Deltaproteobacteria bacterium]|nr:phosphatase PAP2 family protein [Deltaproteobacteria bacterium]
MKKRWIATYVFALCLTLTSISYLFGDIAVAKYCLDLNPFIKNLADVITSFGIATWYIVGSLALYLFFRFFYKNSLNAARSLFVFLSLSFSGIFITILKWIAGRHRPIDFFDHGYFGFDYFGVGYELTSFPSGHAQTVFALATALTILFPRWGVPLFVVATIISITRIILTSHYLSDVIAGAGVGILCTLAVKYFFDRKEIELIKVKE